MPSVAVIGGGPAGATAAWLLADRGFEVCLVHRRQRQVYKAGETLPPVANGLLQRLGISELIKQGSHITCPGNQSAFGSAELVDLDFIFSPHGQGWHLDRLAFQQQLLDRAERQGVKVIDSDRLHSSCYSGNRWELRLHSKSTSQSLHADWVIDASGIARAFLRQRDVAIQIHDKLAARIAVFKTRESGQDKRTLIEASENGWWYSTSAPNNTRIVMYFSDMDLPDFKSCGETSNFMKLLGNTRFISNRLDIECDSDLLSCCLNLSTEPAQSTLPATIQGRQWFAIGDAAMSFDPLSSQGIWRGLQAAEIAAGHIAQQLEKPADNPLSTHYSDWVSGIFHQYLNERKNYYAMEQRWHKNPFWQRRLTKIHPFQINSELITAAA